MVSKTIIQGCKNSVIPNNENVQIIGNQSFRGIPIIELVLPDNITTIERWAFYNARSLTTIVMSQNLQKIETYAFYCCTNLKSVILYQNVDIVETEAFYGCSATIYVEHASQPVSWGDNWNCNCKVVWGYKE